jgi:hypothetical protein
VEVLRESWGLPLNFFLLPARIAPKSVSRWVVNLHRGTIPADDHPVTVMLDFNPVGAGRRS